MKTDVQTHDCIVTEEQFALAREEYKKADASPDYVLNRDVVRDHFKD